LAVLSTSASIATPGLPVGSIQAFAGANAPTGWLLCDGGAISRGQYPDLYSAIGTVYGAGDGASTFNLPDLRGRVPAGKDNMGGTAAIRLTTSHFGGTATNLGATGGSESHTLTTAQLAVHNHSDAGHSHPPYPGYEGYWQEDSQSGVIIAQGGNFKANSLVPSTGTGYSNIQNAGSGNAHNNTQPTLIVNYIIKAIADIARGGWYTQSSPPVITQLPTNPAIGDEVYYLADLTNGIYWHLKYDGQGTYPWKYLGGPSLSAIVVAQTTTAAGTASGGTPSVAIPLAGDYTVNYGGLTTTTTGTAGQYAVIVPYYNGSGLGQDHEIGAAGLTSYTTAAASRVFTFSVAATLALYYRADASTGIAYFLRRYVNATPIRVKAA